ncbi:hypothetical protein A3H10_00430 [Candidatus Uhrbacteria bacterium RIFCSPLOWO2_12_FULL_46_10]|uniref:Enolase n=1 Tax=Candidatus Uhrbacteria bacterium RIFCSPLOWO2_01_FULL_47_25 TaxID=1802402 RepID=A0A1F7US37_9BACT|nr:MAG: Alpha enolase [Parcubacteria group bacterium GW2011_GWA2_46_9]OGL68476.1 MAG: hypothetical protein A3D60_02565 [Candidatus Uhrbacteria bacterium RIFCSPHIGHO2_02_FULL_47_29]OGL81112.1 MAG: hypothetical protein A2936_00735 [Candidatus Uhrbacteria bacterium RIFCSPLOWO2_01_FULL_47_25]OGL86425.1 MAG: hypothetical protein A3I37_02010 [Candidatus Uhrbacteria bacterium RIFCSPLOWO2_02_FULL_46_19]OGL91171.1 MAG: hypothetical protein A3H10_00430 [Candidatus Uhrbacteria bacterium RIFCSPLOWO2_12_FUL
MSKISSLKARKILDSRGEWTVEVTATAETGETAVFSEPRGKSRGKYEEVSVSTDTAVENIEQVIASAIKGFEVEEQVKIDERLLELDGTETKSALGENAILGASLACARLASVVKKVPLWQHLNELSGLDRPSIKPRLFINIINGGLHAGGNLDFQEYLIIPRADRFMEAVENGINFYRALREYLVKIIGGRASLLGDEGGFAPDFKNNAEPFEVFQKIVYELSLQDKIDFGLDAAASNVRMNNNELTAFYKELYEKHNLWYLEDPFAEDDFDSFAGLLKEWNKGGLIAGDDLTVTNIKRIKQAAEKKSINAVIIKPNQIGTLTETLGAAREARQLGWKVIVSHRSGETNDDFISDLAYGIGADGLKLGAPARGERVAKYNRLLAIEAEE